jgi:hypothetical protein
MENKYCQIDYEQTSSNVTDKSKTLVEPKSESLLSKCSICKTIRSHSNFVKNKNQKYGIGYVL